MAQSPLLNSFDPLATHPFTNNSGLAPRPPQPSKYPNPTPSPSHQSHFPATFPTSPAQSASPSSPPAAQSPLKSPQPRRREPGSPRTLHSPTRPIFVPFRQETSSPELVLKKKSASESNDNALGKQRSC